MQFDHEKESGLSAAHGHLQTNYHYEHKNCLKSSATWTQAPHQAILPEQIPIALQQTTMEQTSQPRIGRMATKADKVLAATTKGKMKTTTQTTTSASKQTMSTEQQQQPAIMCPPYIYQANAALPPLAPRVHFNQINWYPAPSLWTPK